MPNNAMLEQIESLPRLLVEQLPELDRRVRDLMTHEECYRVKQVLVYGCGDSHNAALASTLAFQQFAQLPVRACTSMEASRSIVPYMDRSFPLSPLAIGISVSGEVARTVEASSLARQCGAFTVAITGSATSRLAATSERVLDCAAPELNGAPGIRTYQSSLLSLFLLSIRLAEVRNVMTQSEANSLRQELADLPDVLAATVAACREPAQQLAGSFTDSPTIVFVGDGIQYATALFGAAKVIEASGRHGQGVETEEWAHLNYFVDVDSSTPTVLILENGPGQARALELLPVMQRIGRRSVVLAAEPHAVNLPQTVGHLPIAGAMRRAFSPLVFAIGVELLAAYLADAIGATYFRCNDARYIGGNGIRTSAIINELSVAESR